MPDRWPAILTTKLMREYLGGVSRRTLYRRLQVLSLPPRDMALGGWSREEVDQAIRDVRGLRATVEGDGSEWMEAARNDQT